MSVFKEVALTWCGVEYKVAPEKIMGLIETVEDTITLEELFSCGTKTPRAKLARAYADALNYAGASVKPEEIYTRLFGAGMLDATVGAVQGLLSLMIPPEHLRKEAPEGPVSANKNTKKKVVRG